jgi:hypothetical protein
MWVCRHHIHLGAFRNGGARVSRSLIKLDAGSSGPYTVRTLRFASVYAFLVQIFFQIFCYCGHLTCLYLPVECPRSLHDDTTVPRARPCFDTGGINVQSEPMRAIHDLGALKGASYARAIRAAMLNHSLLV